MHTQIGRDIALEVAEELRAEMESEVLDDEPAAPADLGYALRGDGTLRIEEFLSQLFRKFEQGSGYYGWSGLRYFLIEYAQQLLSGSRQSKVEWADLLKPGGDRISIEHVYPQTPGAAWEAAFAELSAKERSRYMGMLGNLLLLSMSVNSALQNVGFDAKKQPVWDASGRKTRNGYADGSHSEIEVSAKSSWGRPKSGNAARSC